MGGARFLETLADQHGRSLSAAGGAVFAFRALFRDIPTLLSLFLIVARLTALTTGLILPALHRRLGA